MSRLKVGDASGDNCISCGSSISADNKSPVPLCCFPCYEDQSRIEEALEESEPQVLDSEVVEEFCPETPSKTSSHGEVPSEKVVEAAPSLGGCERSVKRLRAMVCAYSSIPGGT